MPDSSPASPTPPAVVPPAASASPAASAKPLEAPKPASATPPTPPEAPAEKQDPKISSAWAALTRKEREIQADKARWKAQKESEAAQHARDIADAKELATLREAAKTDPRKYKEIAEKFGLDYDKWTQVQLNDGEVPPDLEVEALRKEIEDLKQGLTKEKTEEQEKSKKSAAAQAEVELVEARNEGVKLVYALPDEKVELVKALQLGPYVVQLVEEHWNTTQEWIAPEVAAQELEKALQNGQDLPDVPFSTAFKKLSETKWFQSKYQPVAAPVEAPAPKVAPVQTTRVVSEKPAASPPVAGPTITNRLTTSSSYPSVDRTKGGSYREKVRAAALAKAFGSA